MNTKQKDKLIPGVGESPVWRVDFKQRRNTSNIQGKNINHKSFCFVAQLLMNVMHFTIAQHTAIPK